MREGRGTHFVVVSGDSKTRQPGDVPTLVIHGDSDRIVPFSAAGQRTAQLIKGAELVVFFKEPMSSR